MHQTLLRFTCLIKDGGTCQISLKCIKIYFSIHAIYLYIIERFPIDFFLFELEFSNIFFVCSFFATDLVLRRFMLSPMLFQLLIRFLIFLVVSCKFSQVIFDFFIKTGLFEFPTCYLFTASRFERFCHILMPCY